MRRIAGVSMPALLLAAVLAVAGCAGDAAVLHEEEPWEVASLDALVLDEVTASASRPEPVVAEVVVVGARPEMVVPEVVVTAEQPEGLPAPAEVSANAPVSFRSRQNVF